MNADLRNWLRLVRLPNALTVPGDVLAGFFLAGGPTLEGGWLRLGYAAGAAVTAYLAGALLDARAGRADARAAAEENNAANPLASGAIAPQAVGFVYVVAVLSALNLAIGAGGGTWRAMPTAATAALLACVALYAAVRRRAPRAEGALAGLCRAAGVAVGASVCPAPHAVPYVPFPLHGPLVYAGAFALFLYAAAAGFAVRAPASAPGAPPARSQALPFAALMLALGPALLARTVGRSSPVNPVIALAFAVPAVHALLLWRVYPRFVSGPALRLRHVRNLMRAQAALVLATAAGAASCAPAVIACLGIYVLSSVYNIFAPRGFAAAEADAQGVAQDGSEDPQVR